MRLRVFLHLTPSPADPKPGSVPPQETVLALGQDTVKLKQKTVEVQGKAELGDPPGARGKVSLVVPEMCDTEHNVLECCAGQGLWEWWYGGAAGGTHCIQPLPCFPG